MIEKRYFRKGDETAFKEVVDSIIKEKNHYQEVLTVSKKNFNQALSWMVNNFSRTDAVYTVSIYQGEHGCSALATNGIALNQVVPNKVNPVHYIYVICTEKFMELNYN